jgi:hypothetical protein
MSIAETSTAFPSRLFAETRPLHGYFPISIKFSLMRLDACAQENAAFPLHGKEISIGDAL